MRDSPQYAGDQVRATQTLIDPYIRNGYSFFRAPFGGWNGEPSTILADHGLDKLIGPIYWDAYGNMSPASPWGTDNNPEYPADTHPIGADFECMAFYESALAYTPQAAVAACGQLMLDAITMAGNKGILLMHDRYPDCYPGQSTGTNRPLLLTQWIVEHLPRSQYNIVPLDAVPDLIGSQNLLPTSQWTGAFSDDNGYGQSRTNYLTVRYADLNDDGRTDICARRSDGVYCALNDGSSSFGDYRRWSAGTDYSDADGWAHEKWATSMQLGDINHDGRADVCFRGYGTVYCSVTVGPPLSSSWGFGPMQQWNFNGDFSDLAGWDIPSRYRTVRLADVNGDGFADMCGRGAAGIYCGLSNGLTFDPATLWSAGANYADTAGWGQEQYGSTIQFGNLNSDNRADVCVRGEAGIYCSLSTGSNSFSPHALTPFDFSNQDHWGEEMSLYGSIRLADVNADGLADVCGRNRTGIACSDSNGDGTFSNYHYITNSDFGDNASCNDERYGPSLGIVSLAGNPQPSVAVCIRGRTGVWCAKQPPTTAQRWAVVTAPIYHIISHVIDSSLEADTVNDPAGYFQFGPYVTTVAPGPHRAFWSLLIDNNSADNASVVSLDVYDATQNVVIASRTVTRQEWTAAHNYQRFELPFSLASNQAGHMLEFRVFWHDTAYVRQSEFGVGVD